MRAFQLELRSFMYPRVLAAIARAEQPCAGCPGRMTFTAYDEIPAFTFTEPPARARVRSAFATAAWLAALALVLAGAGLARASWRLG